MKYSEQIIGRKQKRPTKVSGVGGVRGSGSKILRPFTESKKKSGKALTRRSISGLQRSMVIILKAISIRV